MLAEITLDELRDTLEDQVERFRTAYNEKEDLYSINFTRIEGDLLVVVEFNISQYAYYRYSGKGKDCIISKRVFDNSTNEHIFDDTQYVNFVVLMDEFKMLVDKEINWNIIEIFEKKY